MNAIRKESDCADVKGLGGLKSRISSARYAAAIPTPAGITSWARKSLSTVARAAIWLIGLCAWLLISEIGLLTRNARHGLMVARACISRCGL